jgi:hypothetical protein
MSRLKTEESASSDQDTIAPPQRLVAGPAVGLMGISVICIVSILISMCFDVGLLASGAASEMPQPSVGVSKETQISMRMMWAVAMLASSVIILGGAIAMKRLRNYVLARTAAVLAVIPCLSPFCVLGIPFGVWALSALARDSVRDSFQ